MPPQPGDAALARWAAVCCLSRMCLEIPWRCPRYPSGPPSPPLGLQSTGPSLAPSNPLSAPFLRRRSRPPTRTSTATSGSTTSPTRCSGSRRRTCTACSWGAGAGGALQVRKCAYSAQGMPAGLPWVWVRGSHLLGWPEKSRYAVLRCASPEASIHPAAQKVGVKTTPGSLYARHALRGGQRAEPVHGQPSSPPQASRPEAASPPGTTL